MKVVPKWKSDKHTIPNILSQFTEKTAASGNLIFPNALFILLKKVNPIKIYTLTNSIKNFKFINDMSV